MVRGAIKDPDEQMSFKAKVVFAIIVFLAAGGFLFALLAKNTSGATKAGLDRQDCRSVFTAPITDANAENTAADNKVRLAQVLGQYYGAVDNEALFLKSVELGFTGLHDQYNAEYKLAFYNDQYQLLILAQENDKERFKELCEAGPQTAPPPPKYIPPPR